MTQDLSNFILESWKNKLKEFLFIYKPDSNISNKNNEVLTWNLKNKK